MTRGRQANHALVVDTSDTTDPAERLTEIVTRPTTVESALAVRARLHREAGLEPPDHQRPAQRPSRPKASSPEPSPQSEAHRLHQEKIEAARARLDRAQHRLTHPSPDRGLGL